MPGHLSWLPGDGASWASGLLPAPPGNPPNLY